MNHKPKKTLGLKTPSRSLARTRRALGQNFLRSPQIAEKLVNAARITNDDIVVEVGPGKGIVTQALLAKAKKVIAVEKDKNLVEFLQEKFSQEIKEEKLIVVLGDILKFDITNYKLQVTSYKLVGSLPYYITSHFLRIFLSHEFQPKTIALIIQKEVAERIAREKKESMLSLSVKVYGSPRYIKTVKAGGFCPKPKVDSAVFVIENISKKFFKDIPEENFFKLLKAGFAGKRKKLITNLKKNHPKETLEEIFNNLNISLNIRAEDLSLREWEKLFLKISAKT